MSRRIMLKFGCLVAVIAALGLSVGRMASVNPETKTHTPMPEARGEAAVKHLKQAGLYDSLYQAVQETRYQVKEQAGGYKAANPAHNYVTHFTADGIQVKATDRSNNAWRLGMRLSGYGYGARKVEVGPGRLTASNNEVSYERRAKDGSDHKITEWYVNRPTGIEQGFTIPSAPGERGDGERLTLRLELSGNLEARLDEAGAAITMSEGGAELRYDHLYAYDARGRALGARMSLSGKELRLEVDDAAAVYPVTIDPLLTQQKLTAGDAAAGDQFGSAVAIKGELAVVGAPFDNNPGADSGSAYVFGLVGTTWIQEQKLTPSDGAAGDRFGVSVAIDGVTIVVGASLDDSPGAANSGSAYVFTQNGTTWTQQQKLTAGDGAAQDQFGNSVAISGNTVVATAFQDDAPLANSGSAYVFLRVGTTWSLQQKLTTSDAATNDRLGFSAGIDNDTIVLGAQDDDSPTFNSGSAYVFVRAGTTWSQQQRLTASDGASNDLFGHSVGISGQTIVVGAIWDDDAGADSGSAYVFLRSGTTWTQQQKLTAGDGAAGDMFGESVAISADRIAAGSSGDDDAGGDSGSAYVFARTASTWGQQDKITATDAAAGDAFGDSIAISGVTVLIGAPGNDDAGSNSGSAYTTKTGALIDLAIAVTEVNAQPNDIKNIGISVSNFGEAATGPVHVTIFPPNFVNFDSFPVPLCQFVHQNPADTVPEGIVCTIPKEQLEHDETFSFQVSIKVVSTAPQVRLLGMTMALPAVAPNGAPISNDVETYVTDNFSRNGVNIDNSGFFVPTGVRDLYLRGNIPALVRGGTTSITLTVGNNGPAPTTDKAIATMVTPFFVNFGAPLPSGCTKLLEDPRPNFPEIIQCETPGPLASGSEHTFVLPLTVVPGGPDNLISGNAAVDTVSALDVDPDRTDNYFIPAALILEDDVEPCPQLSFERNLKKSGREQDVAASRGGKQAPRKSPTKVAAGTAASFKPGKPGRLGKPGGIASFVSRYAPGVYVPPNLDVDKRFLQAAIDRRTRQALPVANPGKDAHWKVSVNPPKPGLPAGAKAGTSGGAIGAKSILQSGGRVDLTLTASVTVPDFTVREAIRTFEIGNTGESATGDVWLIYATSPLINFKRPIPPNCVFLNEDPDFEVPEIVRCTLPGPQSGGTVSFSIPTVYAPNAPTIPLSGQATVVPAAGSADKEQFPNNNVEFPTLGLPSSLSPGGTDMVNLYATSVLPNIRVDRPATEIITVGNRGSVATQGQTRLVFTTPMNVNIDRNRPLPAVCGFLFQNQDPNVPEIVECILPPGIDPCEEIPLSIPVVLVPGAPTGMHTGNLIVRPVNPEIDINQDLTQSTSVHGVVASTPPLHDLILFLHGNDIPGTAGGFTMNLTPPPPSTTLFIGVGSSLSWFSDPPLNGTFTPASTFQLQAACALGLGVGARFSLASTDLNGGSVQPLGSQSLPLAVCLGSFNVTIPVTTPVNFNNRRLKLTIDQVLGLGLTLQGGPNTFLKGTNYSGTP